MVTAYVSRTLEPRLEVGIKLSWAWAVAFFVPAVLGFFPNPLIGPDALFETNATHNLVHLVTAVAFAATTTLGNAASVRFMKAFGVVYLLVGVLGFAALGGAATGQLLGVVHINGADNYLHLGLGAGILASGFFAGAASRAGGQGGPRSESWHWAP